MLIPTDYVEFAVKALLAVGLSMAPDAKNLSDRREILERFHIRGSGRVWRGGRSRI